MNFPQQRHRNALWLVLGLSLPALVLPIPYLKAQSVNAQSVNQGSTKGPVVDNPKPSFERADRNRDGFIDKSEAGTVPGLSANFERADRNKDGKLDREEFTRGLVIVGQK